MTQAEKQKFLILSDGCVINIDEILYMKVDSWDDLCIYCLNGCCLKDNCNKDIKYIIDILSKNKQFIIVNKNLIFNKQYLLCTRANETNYDLLFTSSEEISDDCENKYSTYQIRIEINKKAFNKISNILKAKHENTKHK